MTAQRLKNVKPEVFSPVRQYGAQNVVWMPKETRWSRFQLGTKKSTIGKVEDHTVGAIERMNRAFRDTLAFMWSLPHWLPLC